MFEQYRKILSLLDRREKKVFVVLVGIMILSAFAEILGLSVFMALLAVLSQPERIQEIDLLRNTYARFGFESIFAFQLTLSILVAIVIFIGLVVKAGTFYATMRFATFAGHRLSVRMMRAYLLQPYSWSLNRNTADLSRKILVECESLVQRVLRPSLGILASCIMSICIVGFLVNVDPVIALVSFGILGGGYGGVYLLVRKPLNNYGRKALEANRWRYRIALEATSGFKDVKLAGLEDIYVEEYRRPSLRRAHFAILGQVLTSFPRYVLEGLTFAILLSMVLILLVRNEGDLLAAVPTIGIFGFAVMRILPALQQVYFGFAALRTGISIVDMIHEDYLAVNAHQTQLPLIDRTSRMDLNEAIVFDHVSFSYPNANKVALHDISTTIKTNSTIGIVGGTGAGKTTFVDLLLGLLSVDQGHVTVDGTPLEGDAVRAWQNTIGYVPQQIFLTDSSVTANIAFGIPENAVDMEAVLRAAKAAALHDFVMEELPDGYETSVGDRGVRLSGGQRQRIGIARALYHDPSLLILDEATSALDMITERAVMQAVHNLRNRKTIIMIAHRLSTVESCDRILLMEKGRIVAEDTFAALAETNPVFQQMLGKKSA